MRKASPALRDYLEYYIDIDKKLFKAFADNLMNEIVSNPEGCTLPGNLGFMKVVGNRSTPKESPAAVIAVNGKFTRDRKKARFNNYHTDGKTFTTVWYSQVIGNTEDILKKAFRNSDIYVFKASKPFKYKLFDKITTTKMWTLYHMKSFFKAAKTYAQRGRPRKDGTSKVAEGVNLNEDDQT